ncbi:MAG: ATP-binding protein [Chloroflexota bacterium]
MAKQPTHNRQTFFLLKKVNQAIRQHNLIAEGDRIAVAVSGGKDSLSLLHLLGARQCVARERYDLVAVHVIPAADAPCGSGQNTTSLEAWLQSEAVEYILTPMQEVDSLPEGRERSPCFHCAWRRRKALFLAADRMGCNKVALGHHADDAAQTTLLNLFYQGRLESMRPRVSFFDHRLTLIRPLIYVPEKELVRLAAVCGFPPPPAACVNGQASRRALMAQLLRTVEKSYPKVKINLWRAVERTHQTSDPTEPRPLSLPIENPAENDNPAPN